MQMDARRWRCCGWCFGCGELKPHSAYIKNNHKLIALQTTTATLKIISTTTKTKSSSSYNNVAAVRKISLAYRPQAAWQSKGRTGVWPQTQLTFVATIGSYSRSSHGGRINVQRHLTSRLFTLSLISYTHIGWPVVALTDSGKPILQKAVSTHFVVTKSHLPQPFAPRTMGSCFGRCVAKDVHGVGATTATSCLWRQQRATDEQEAELVSNASDKCPRENFIYRIVKFKTKQKRPQFIDKFWEQQDMQYTKLASRNGTEGLSDIQLQNLDVHNLLSNTILAKESAINYCLTEAQYAAASSRASSSLDLEWEHEYGQMRQLYQPPHNTHRSTQSLLPTNTNNNSKNNLSEYINSNSTPIHQLHALNNNNTLRNSKRSATYDNHPPHVHLNDSWQYLNNDEEQLNSLGSYSQSQSLPHAPLNVAAATLPVVKTAERCELRAYMRREPQPPINERRNSSFTRTFSSHNSWSHISTPESLEWDQDEEQQRQLRVEDDNLDHETLELLHQIEQLKNRVLDETGDGLYENGMMGVESVDMSEGIHFVVGGQNCADDGRKDIS